MGIIEERTKRTEWFLNDRFGMFIHWGLYAIPSRGEWVRSIEQISVTNYQKYFDEFDPINYNPKEWAKAAKAAGMKYAVLTAKHHDGFCLFDSKLTEYKCTNTKAKRDLVAEYLEAFRAEGIKVGLYYSLLDWHHDDYPHYTDRIHPMRKDEKTEDSGSVLVANTHRTQTGNNESYKDKKHDFSKYIEYFHGQVKELLTDYGKIDLMWFDFSYDDMVGEKWEATKLVNMMRSIQPDIIIDSRLGGNIKSTNPEVYSGDFAGPEQIIPTQGVTDENGNSIPWEACITLNDNWGYCSTDLNYKTSKTIIRTLVECVSKNGNFLLNIGPNAKGEIPVESLKILSEIGTWMSKNSDSIYGAGISTLPRPEWGRYTQKGKYLYAHILERGIGLTNFNNLAGKLKSATLVSDGSEIKLITEAFNIWEFPNDAFIELKSSILPDDNDTVIKLELK